MKVCWLKFTTKSDSTFGKGEGLAGLVDVEVVHDKYGLPFLSGKTLKGLLEEECSGILFSLKEQKIEAELLTEFYKSAQHLFGNPGSSDFDKAILHISNATLPTDLKKVIEYEEYHHEKKLSSADILNSLTSIRHQTSIDEISGAPKKNSLRSMRVILRKTPFEAKLLFTKDPSGLDLPLLAACVKAFRRAGTGRNRGRGKLVSVLCNEAGANITEGYFKEFCKEVMQ
jgi:CRISPR/Cas system CSM-associated protein Csm3 (group 7 of RAMP superfamily)